MSTLMSKRFEREMTDAAPMVRRIRQAMVGAIVIGVFSVGGALVACSNDQGTATAPLSPANTIASIVVSPLNAIIAVGDTVSVTFVARSLSGGTMTQFDSVKYFLQNVSDSLRLQLLPNGQVIGRSPSGTNAPVLVDVLAFKNGIAAADQAVVQVTATKFADATLSIQPVGSDSAKIAWGDTKRIIPVIRNASGQSVTRPTVRFEYGPGDSTILQCYVPTIPAVGALTTVQLRLSDCGVNANAGSVRLNQIHAFHKGTAWVHAHVLVYGVMLHDSVQYTISNPYNSLVVVYPSNFRVSDPGANTVIAPGGTITFLNGFDVSMGVSVSFTFDHPEMALATDPPATYGDTIGNVSAITSTELLSTRRFQTPGVYTWTATIIGGIPPYTGGTATGTITVE